MIRSGLGRGGPQRTHGLSSHPLYAVWHTMKNRCYNPASISYSSYGGRGITVCAEWRDDVVAFINWVETNLGPRPAGKSLDRVDNYGDYEPGNLRWASRAEQRVNRRVTRRATDFDWPWLWHLALQAELAS